MFTALLAAMMMFTPVTHHAAPPHCYALLVGGHRYGHGQPVAVLRIVPLKCHTPRD